MKKLLLTSFACKTLDLVKELLPGSASGLKAAFIPTAGDPYDDKEFIDVDRDKLIEMGFEVTDVDLKTDKAEFLEKKLADINLVLVAGGNTFYLLDHVRKSGFDKVIKRLISKGVIYVGSSAGSILCCPTIEGAKRFDSIDSAPDLTDYVGLDIFEQIIIPHANKERYAARIKETKNEMEQKGFVVSVLNDNQAIIVNDEDWKIVGN